jgi:hypothetical protein
VNVSVQWLETSDRGASGCCTFDLHPIAGQVVPNVSIVCFDTVEGIESCSSNNAVNRDEAGCQVVVTRTRA